MARYAFTYHQEIGHQGQSLVPHFPGGNSGVTIGPGYDMGHRSSTEIYNDLTRVGIDHDTAQILSEAASMTGYEAQRWINQHGGVYISEEQQSALYNDVLVPEYERRMGVQLATFAREHEGITPDMIDLHQLDNRQKEILFDYTYNAGLSRFPTLVEAVLKKDWETVGQHFERFSGDMPLTYRNEMFYQHFLSAESDQNFSQESSSDNELVEINELIDDFGTETDGISSKDETEDIDHLLDDTQW
jgi:hypothetical protein